ncbi:hypothetical protein ABPG75_006721 [Micractinium tetrahymenae]
MLLLEPGACEAIDPEALLARCDHYARREGASAETLARLDAFCRDPVTRAILALPEAELDALLLNDAYKARMHKLYARYMPRVVTDFELSVRRTPVPLAQIRDEDPELWRRFQRACADRLGVPPYPPAVVETLNTCFPDFRCSEEMLARAECDGVAPLTWQEMDGQLVAFSHGPVEASSHVETTLTQLVQEVTVAAQVRRLQRQRGVQLTPTELLGNSLAKLALGVEALAAEAQFQAQAARLLATPGQPAEAPPALALFASRRSTSRRYLLLQNWYCSRHLPLHQGTSAIMAVTLLRQLLQGQQQGEQQEEEEPAGSWAQQAEQPEAGAGKEQPGNLQPEAAAGGQQPGDQQPEPARGEQQAGRPLLRLVGTLAHEVMMICDQLLGCFNELGSSAGGTADSQGPAQVCALLAHLLLLAAGGGLQAATALCDTFGTRGFVSAALAARIPQEFRQDMEQQFPDQWAALPDAVRVEGARVFDLFSWWRMDSGGYEEMASYVSDAWEARWGGQLAEARPPRPRLMHSNLESFDEIIDMWRLPPRIRPAAFAFGTLADGFLPFDAPGGASSSGGSGAGGSGGAGGGSSGSGSGVAAGTRGAGGCNAGAASDGRCGSGSGSSSGSGDAGERFDIRLASVVMKAVQNRHVGAGRPCSTESAGKLGDDASASKAQFDCRLPPDAVERTRQRMLLLSRERPGLDCDAVSAALAAAYHAVTREGALS